MAASDIIVKGAREHNLRDVNLILPRHQLICLTGVSGSGKSSLAFDTLYAEGQRRYVESLSSFARQFLGQMPKPDVDYIGGLSPSISISQKSSGQNPRSTVGTITEIYDYLRVLFARIGQGNCHKCQRPITAQSREQLIEHILSIESGTRLIILAPLVRRQKGEYRDLFEDLLKQGFARARVDGEVIQLVSAPALDRQMRHDIEVVIDRLVAGKTNRTRLAEAVDLALKLGDGGLIVAQGETTEGKPKAGETDSDSAPSDGAATTKKRRTAGGSHQVRQGDLHLSALYACTHCQISFEPPSPQLFSFNSPQGMCLECDGLGEFYSFDPDRLVTSPKRSFGQGCIELSGPFKEMGRWRRHILKGVAETMEQRLGLEAGTMVDTPWVDLDPKLQYLWLWGTGTQHITFTWRRGANAEKHGGVFEGIIPELLDKYRGSQSKMQTRKLEKYMSVIRCPDCCGQRLNPQARSVTITSADPQFAKQPARSLPEVCRLPISDARNFFSELVLSKTQTKIAGEAIKEIRGRLGFLTGVGLEYLSLERTAPTLSGGESQRIRLAGQVGCGLVGVLYILDEPSIGLHPRDNDRLLGTLTQLRDLGNTVIVVEHDEDTMRAADHIVDFGPGAGVRGGEVVGEGSIESIEKSRRSVTGDYLSGRKKIAVPTTRRAWPNLTKVGTLESDTKPLLRILGAQHNNLKKVDVEIPLGTFVCVTGVSGSGKSSLINDILVEALRRDLNNGNGEPGQHDRIEGLEHLDKMIAIDQTPIGRTPRSNPATYIKIFDDIRNLFCQLPDAKRRGYKPGRFSFNVSQGRCEACEGNGSNKLEMDFLADVWVTCPVCRGHRFNHETLQIRFKGKSISDVLEMDIQQAIEHFENIPKIRHKLQTLHDVGLDYMKLGQPSPTLSGGEAQRIKLAKQLVKKSTGRTLYLLDEPTTGLHFADIEMLLQVLHGFVDAGNTVLVVEHNLDVVKTADWVIDLGPEGGAEGGHILVEGTPEQVAENPDSYTGVALRKVLDAHDKPESNGSLKKNTAKEKPAARRTPQIAREIIVRGASQHNLKHVDAKIPRDQITVCVGMSGSGKTSLAMDTIYAEGQRRYVESLSSYARQFVGQAPKPKLDHIEGLSPAIAIEQKNMGSTPRSTVGTVTEIYDYLRILFSRSGQPYCPDCDIPISTQTTDEIVEKIMSEPDGTKVYLTAPLELQTGQRYETLWEDLQASGYVRVRVDGETHTLQNPPQIDRRRRHAVAVVVDRVTINEKSRSRIAESTESALSLGKGQMEVVYADDDLSEARWKTRLHSQLFVCEKCSRSFEPLTPHHFSFNSQIGWCEACEGLGTQTGANPAALLSDPNLTLAEGVLRIWPDLSGAASRAMLNALSQHTNIPTDVPYRELSARCRRILLHGTGDDWIEVFPDGTRKKRNARPVFRFQFKGLYPALADAARISPSLRSRLEHLIDEVDCSACGGSRLRDDAAAVRFRERTIDEICRIPLGKLILEMDAWKLKPREKKVAGEVLREINNRMQFLTDVGLDYLTIGRSAPTLSGGEAQRIRLAAQVGSGLCGVLYVLDEPTIGLHPRDNRRLLSALTKLRDLGNTLLIVEHDREVIEAADQVLDFGPKAGRHGGEIVARGTPAEIAKRRASVTGPYLSGKKAIPIPINRRLASVYESRLESNENNGKRPTKKKTVARKTVGKSTAKKVAPVGVCTSIEIADHLKSRCDTLEIIGAKHNNLRGINVPIPLGVLTAISGVSGSGKSSLIEDILYNSLARTLHRARTSPGAHDSIRGLENINKVIRVNQQPLGNSPSSNPATYTGLFELIRALFAQLPESKVRGFSPRRFSFNVPGGRCEQCEGNGQQCIEMHFLPDVWVECETCRGKRYNPETLAVTFHGQSIADVLDLSCAEAVELFKHVPKIRRTLQTLCDVGLDYVKLGQPAPTLSGGEAQRVKLAAELSRPDTGRTLYLLDEPTTGLHFEDLAKLLDVMHRLVDLGNSVVVIEHNLDILKSADWIIDMGPEAGEGGGYVVTAGTPEDLAQYALIHDKENKPTAVKKKGRSKTGGKKASSQKTSMRSYTAEVLTPVLEAGPYRERKEYDIAKSEAERSGDMDISEVGQNAKVPWEIDGRRWHTKNVVDRKGEPVRWDKRVLEQVVDRIQELGNFSATNWRSRSIVEISAEKKTHGWFMHAITGETWLLKLKFRIAKRTFRREELVPRLALTPLNDLDELPVYGTSTRVKCKNLRGPWQEIEMHIHSLEEIDRPEFWSFLEEAVAGFDQFVTRVETKPEDVMPWKVLGQKWHLSRKGFPPGKRVHWEQDVLEELCELLDQIAKPGRFLWNNQQVVHMFVPGQKEPWASIHTKTPSALELVLNGPKDLFAYGRVTKLGSERDMDTKGDRTDQFRIKFKSSDDLESGDLSEFLKEHFSGVVDSADKTTANITE